MGNKIGFQVDSEDVKLVYIQKEEQKIKFIENLQSKYLQHKFEREDYKIFIFKCSIKEFLEYHKNENAKIIREQYKSMLITTTKNNTEDLIINTNNETINSIKKDQNIMEALRAIVLHKVKFQHQTKAQMSLEALYFLQNSGEYFQFSEKFSLVELNSFNLNLVNKKKQMERLPKKFLLILIRNGISIYRAEKEKKLQRISGSIIGEKSILAILKLKFPHKKLQNMIEDAFQKGCTKNLDLLVSDIYGNNTKSLGLPGDLIASSLGKLGKMNKEEIQKLSEDDICRSLLTSFAINIGVLASIESRKQKIQTTIVLGDKLHSNYFYILIQSIFQGFSPDKQIFFSKHAPYMSCLGTIFKQK